LREAIVSAGISCVECGARPFPELGPPGTRQDFDLSKTSGEWRCSQHRDVAVKTKAKPATPKWDELESLLDDLGRFVANMDADEGDRVVTLELIDRMGALIGRS
jgi:hypothetical protein